MQLARNCSDLLLRIKILAGHGPGMQGCAQPLRRADVVRDLHVVVQEVHRPVVERVVRRHRLCRGGRRELCLPVPGHLEPLRRDHAWQRGRQGYVKRSPGERQHAFARSSACSAGAAARTALAARVGDAVWRAGARDGRAGQCARAICRVAERVIGARLRPARVHVSHGRALALAYAVLFAACT